MFGVTLRTQIHAVRCIPQMCAKVLRCAKTMLIVHFNQSSDSFAGWDTLLGERRQESRPDFFFHYPRSWSLSGSVPLSCSDCCSPPMPQSHGHQRPRVSSQPLAASKFRVSHLWPLFSSFPCNPTSEIFVSCVQSVSRLSCTHCPPYAPEIPRQAIIITQPGYTCLPNFFPLSLHHVGKAIA